MRQSCVLAIYANTSLKPFKLFQNYKGSIIKEIPFTKLDDY